MAKYLETPTYPIKQQTDRLVPSRCAMNLELSSYNFYNDSPSEDEHKSQYNSSVASSLFGERVSHVSLEDQKILALREKAPLPLPGYQNLRALYSQNLSHSKAFEICQKEERTLDAPGLTDDYYLNLIDWSSNNLLAVALHNQLFLLEAASGTPHSLFELPNPEHIITSVSWSTANPSYLSVGTNENTVNLWDVSRGIQVRKLEGHQGRVSSSSWNNALLSTGSADSTIMNWDVRARNPHVSTLSGHSEEVCGLKWSLDGTQLASGANDNTLNIWNVNHMNAPTFRKEEHFAAVKALSWCPWQPGLLASGGGTADRTIKLWNTQNGNLLHSVDTGSQVCSILWSSHRKELISSHGFSKNQLTIWKYPSMTKVTELSGHTSRVLHLAQSPDGTCLLSASADETIKFWRIFDQETNKKPHEAFKSSNSRGIYSSLNRIR